MFTNPIEVTSGRPCYDRNIGLKINSKQVLAEFFNKVFAISVETSLVPESGNHNLSTTNRANAIRVGTGDEADILVSFVRTLRIPEDERVYKLPPGFDYFPLFPIDRLNPKLPAEIVAQGGIFLPMYREFFHSSISTQPQSC